MSRAFIAVFFLVLTALYVYRNFIYVPNYNSHIMYAARSLSYYAKEYDELPRDWDEFGEWTISKNYLSKTEAEILREIISVKWGLPIVEGKGEIKIIEVLDGRAEKESRACF